MVLIFIYSSTSSSLPYFRQVRDVTRIHSLDNWRASVCADDDRKPPPPKILREIKAEAVVLIVCGNICKTMRKAGGGRGRTC